MCANDGMPRPNEPFLSTQKIAPAGACFSAGLTSAGAGEVPSKSTLWQLAHSLTYSLRPARSASGRDSYGLLRLAPFAGGFCSKGWLQAKAPASTVTMMGLIYFLHIRPNWEISYATPIRSKNPALCPVRPNDGDTFKVGPFGMAHDTVGAR